MMEEPYFQAPGERGQGLHHAVGQGIASGCGAGLRKGESRLHLGPAALRPRHCTPALPGTLLAPLGCKDTLPSGPLTPVTLVFCSLDGGLLYSAVHRQDVLRVHLELVAIMRRYVTVRGRPRNR